MSLLCGFFIVSLSGMHSSQLSFCNGFHIFSDVISISPELIYNLILLTLMSKHKTFLGFSEYAYHNANTLFRLVSLSH